MISWGISQYRLMCRIYSVTKIMYKNLNEIVGRVRR